MDGGGGVKQRRCERVRRGWPIGENRGSGVWNRIPIGRRGGKYLAATKHDDGCVEARRSYEIVCVSRDKQRAGIQTFVTRLNRRRAAVSNLHLGAFPARISSVSRPGHMDSSHQHWPVSFLCDYIKHALLLFIPPSLIPGFVPSFFSLFFLYPPCLSLSPYLLDRSPCSPGCGTQYTIRNASPHHLPIIPRPIFQPVHFL